MFKGVEFRFHERHQSNGKGPKSKPEAYVAIYKDGKVWVRDNGKGGLSLGNNDEGKMIKHERITLWLPAFVAETKVECNIIINKCLSDFAAEHPDRLNTDTSTTSDKNGSDTPSVYTTTQSDFEMLQLYHNADSVPDEEAATMIGKAKARSAEMLPVPSSVVIEAKRTALQIGLDDPWISVPYVRYAESLRDNTSKKRKRSDTQPPGSDAQRSWDRLDAIDFPGRKEKFERYQAIVDNYHAKKAERWAFLWNSLR